MKKSYFNLVLSMLIFSSVGIMRRLIPLSSGILAFSRGLLGGVFLLVALKVQKKKRINGGNPLPLIVTGALIALNWVFLFESYNYTTVQTATLAYYMEPAFLILLSPVFFKERLTVKKLLCALSAVLGMVLVSGLFTSGGISSSDVKGILFGLGAAGLYASVIILNKKITSFDTCFKTMVELFSASITIVPYILINEDFSVLNMSFESVLMLLVVGIVHTGFAYWLYFSSVEKISAQRVALISYIDPIGALVLSALFLNESLSIWGIIGAVMIIASSVISEVDFS